MPCPVSTPETADGTAPEAGLRLTRWTYAAAGLISLASGAVGVVVPGWPTTVFWLVAAWCFSKSCPVLQRWIYSRPGVGPVIHDLLEHRRLTPTNKRKSIIGVWLGMGVSAGVLVFLGY